MKKLKPGGEKQKSSKSEKNYFANSSHLKLIASSYTSNFM